MDRLHVGELVQAMQRRTSREPPRRIEVRLAGVVVVDLRGEEFDDAALGGRRWREQRCNGSSVGGQAGWIAGLRFLSSACHAASNFRFSHISTVCRGIISCEARTSSGSALPVYDHVLINRLK